MPVSEGDLSNPNRRNELIGVIGEAIMDGFEELPPFPSMDASVAWQMADEIVARLEQIAAQPSPFRERSSGPSCSLRRGFSGSRYMT